MFICLVCGDEVKPKSRTEVKCLGGCELSGNSKELIESGVVVESQMKPLSNERFRNLWKK